MGRIPAVQIDLPSVTEDRAEALHRESWQWLLGDARGRRILRDVLNTSGIDNAPTVGAIEVMAGEAGTRQLGAYVRQRAQRFDPEGWLRFEIEYLQEAQLAYQAQQRKTAEALEGAAR